MLLPDAPLDQLVLNRAADVFRPVMAKSQDCAPNHLRLAPTRDDLLELAYDQLRRLGEVHLHPHGLAIEVIDNVE